MKCNMWTDLVARGKYFCESDMSLRIWKKCHYFELNWAQNNESHHLICEKKFIKVAEEDLALLSYSSVFAMGSLFDREKQRTREIPLFLSLVRCLFMRGSCR